MSPKDYTPLRRSIDHDISIRSSTVSSIDDEKYDSETESETAPRHPIYTPTSSDDRSAGTRSVDEESPLMSELPPQYEDIPATSMPLPTDRKLDDVEVIEERSSCNLEDPGKGSPSAKELRQCKRRRFRKICLIVSLKLAVLVGIGLYFFSIIGHPWRSWRGGYDDCTPEQVPSSEREIIIDRGSRAIWGQWPLYDLLSLTTTSGSITVNIEPQPADPDDPHKPARVVLKSKSGSIAVSFSAPKAASMPELEMKMDLADLTAEQEVGESPKHKGKGEGKCKDKEGYRHKKTSKKCKNRNKRSYAESHGIEGSSHPLPPRPYEVEVQTESGSIYGRFLFSTQASLESSSGSINAMIIPVVYSDLPSDISLKTATASGHQHVRFTEPFFIPSPGDDSHSSSQAKARLADYGTASHVSSGSGGISVAYPRSWAGNVSASSQSGRISLNGRGLQVTREENGRTIGFKKPAGDEKPVWWGNSGDMDVSLTSEGSGSIDFYVG